MKNRFFLMKLILISLIISIQHYAGQKTFNAASGTWGTAGNWLPAGIPAATDTVTIPAGRSCTITADANCASLNIVGSATATVQSGLTVQSSTNVDGTILFTSTNGTKVFTGLITIGINGLWNCTVNENFSIRGGITNNGSFISGGGTYTFETNDQGLNGNEITFTFRMRISGRTITNNTTTTVSDNLTGTSGGSRFINAENAVLNAGRGVMATGQLTATATGNKVNYYRQGNQTVKGTAYYDLTLSGSGTKTTTGITVNGKLSRQGTATLSALPIYGTSAVLEYKGSTAQTTGVEFPAAMNNAVIIDNINGVSLNGAKTLNDSLHLLNGSLTTTTANLLTIGANGAADIGSALSFVNGPLTRTKNTAALQTLFFPVGKGSAYRPLELIIQHTNTTSSTYRTEVFNTAPPGRTLPPSISSVSNVRYWNITKTGLAGVSSAYVVLYYDTDDGVRDPENLKIAKDNGGSWTDLGGTANGSPSGSILSQAFTTFSDFVLANSPGGSNPLPVELSSFKGVSSGQEVMLTWTTQTETDNYGFDIERSSGNGNWENVGFVEGHGNSNSPKEYSYSEKLISAGKYFYRLKQIDSDGNFKYSSQLEITVAAFPNSYILQQNYPNPFNPSTVIKFSVAEDMHALIKVYDLIGNEVAALFNEIAEAGKLYQVIFDGSAYSSGIYIYTISAGNFSAVRKMMLIK